jgi:hypothetical protein
MAEELALTLHQLRPRLWPFVWAHCMTGFVAGVNWAVLLGGPAAALTLFFGPTEYDAPVTTEPESAGAGPTKTGALAALGMVLLGMVVALLVTWDYYDAFLVGVVVLVANAAPPLRLAALPYGALAVQAFGYAVLTFYAGFVACKTPNPYEHTVALYVSGFVFLFLALRQSFWRVGSRMQPWLFWVSLAAGFVCLGGAAVLAGNRWSLAFMIIPLAVWCVAGLHRYGEPEERVIPGLALGAWLLTDAAVALSAVMR